MFNSLDARRRPSGGFVRLVKLYLGFSGDQGGGEPLQVSGDIYVSGKVKAAAIPYLHVFLNASQTQTPAGATTRLDFDTVTTDNKIWWDSGNKRYVPLVAGRYLVLAGVMNSCNGTTTAGQELLEAYIRKNGVTIATAIERTQAAFTGATGAATNLGKIISMNGTTDYIDVAGYTDVDSNCSFVGSGATDLGRCFLQIEYLGP